MANGNSLLALLRKHRKLLLFIAALIAAAWILGWLVSSNPAFRSEWPPSKETADEVKAYILSYGRAAPLLFIFLQVLQVLFAPIPGQLTGFAGGYVFGWQSGVAFTMSGLAIGTLLVLVLARKLGRPFVEKLNGAEAVRDFERLFVTDPSAASGIYGRSRETLRSHGLLTFFVIMLLPALPDDVVCFVAGLSRIPVWQLLLAAVAGRFPGMLVLSLLGDGFSRTQSNAILAALIGFSLALTALYFWKRNAIEAWMERFAGVKQQ